MSIRDVLLGVAGAVLLSSCSHLEDAGAAGQARAPDLVGAWEVTATRAGAWARTC